MDTITIIDWDAPSKEKDIESTLMISDQDGRFCVEMFFTLYDEFDIQQFSCEGIKRPGDHPIDIEPVTGQRHANGDNHAPY